MVGLVSLVVLKLGVLLWAASEAIAINQDISFSAADRISNNTAGAQVWSRPLSNGDLAVVFYNSHSLVPAKVAVSWEELHLPSSTSLHVRDIWAATNDGPAVGELSAIIKPRDVKFMRLSHNGAIQSSGSNSSSSKGN